VLTHWNTAPDGSARAAEFLLAPVISQFLKTYPDITKSLQSTKQFPSSTAAKHLRLASRSTHSWPFRISWAPNGGYEREVLRGEKLSTEVRPRQDERPQGMGLGVCGRGRVFLYQAITARYVARMSLS